MSVILVQVIVAFAVGLFTLGHVLLLHAILIGPPKPAEDAVAVDSASAIPSPV
jgi:hypothetical protein